MVKVHKLLGEQRCNIRGSKPKFTLNSFTELLLCRTMKQCMIHSRPRMAFARVEINPNIFRNENLIILNRARSGMDKHQKGKINNS